MLAMQSFTATTTRRLVAGCLLAGLALGTAACGDDDETAAADPPAGGDADNGFGAEACDAYLELNGAFAGAAEGPAELPAFGETLVPIVEALVDGLPEALAPDGEVLTAAVAAVAEEGDPEALFSPEGTQAQTNIGAFAFEGCDGERVQVEATEFAFEGIPGELPAGRVNVMFRNNGTDEHEMIVLRRADGSDATFEELAEQGPDALFTEATFAGVTFASPSTTGYTALDLEPGTYFLVCTIPTGDDPDAEPHSAHGMHQTVEVVA